VTVRWGFLGAGNIASVALAPAVHKATGAVLQAAAARDPLRAGALGPITVHDTYQQLLADPAVDAVYLSLSNEAHLPWTLRALAAGKHVLCEKPLCLTAAEVDQIASVQGDLLVVEASWYRWHPRIQLLHELLPRIGTVTHVSTGFAFAGDLEGNYRLDPGRGGGALYDVGHYAVSAALSLVGRGLPADLSATARWSPSGVDLATEAVLSWGDATAEIFAGIDEGRGQWLVVTGTDGQIELRDEPFTSWKDDATQLLLSDGALTEQFEVPAVDAYQVMVEEVSAVLAGGPGWVLPLAESRLTAACLDQIRSSAAASRTT
jgi:xylose dehydrogenase (NAD/NADP)